MKLKYFFLVRLYNQLCLPEFRNPKCEFAVVGFYDVCLFRFLML